MRRTALAALIGLGVAVTAVLSLAGCGSAGSTRSAGGASTPTTVTTTSSGPSRLTVTPSTGGPTTTFTLSLTAPTSSRNLGHARLGYTVSVAGPIGSVGCVAERSVQVPGATQGTPVSVALDPARLGGKWCQGDYTARAVEIETPICAPGEMCPQFIRVVGTVGIVRFRVTG